MDQGETGFDTGEWGKPEIGGATDAGKIVTHENVASRFREAPQRQARWQGLQAIPVGAEGYAAGIDPLASQQHRA